MPLATEEQEQILEVQEWASSIFAAPGHARNLARRQADAAAALIRTSAAGTDRVWPSADQNTASLAMQLDSGPVKRRASHALRSAVREALRWTDHGKVSPIRLADSLANCAVALHAPTSAIRSLCSLARVNVGLWSAVRNGSLRKHIALNGTEDQLREFGRSQEKFVTEEELALWRDWLVTADAEIQDMDDTEPVEKEPQKDSKTEEALKMQSLRDYQKSAVQAVRSISPENCCVVLPCGAGKTRVGAALTSEFLESSPGSAAGSAVVVLCLRREGIRQWKRELSQNWGLSAYEAGASGAAQPGELTTSQVILVTYHRMLCERRRALAENGPEAGGSGSIAARLCAADRGLLIADECHMVPAPKICELLSSLLSSSRRLVGLTATLLRESGVNKEAAENGEGDVPWPLLGKCVFRETFANLAPEYLAPVRCVEVSVPVVGEWRKIFKKQQLAPAVCLSGGKWTVLERLLAKHADDSLLITVERCEQARQIATMFGIIPIDGSVPATQMKEYLERFRQRKILALVATHVLDDSADFPELFVMIQMGGHFASRRQEQQRLGRLLRWGPVKRRRFEETGARPTFYVLVHQGTVEERMSRHRTRSVLGVNYESVDANSLLQSPESTLGNGSDFFPSRQKLQASSFRELDEQHQAAMKKTLAGCVELSKRVANSLRSGKKCREAKLSEIRKWLRGESSPGTPEDQDDEVLVCSSESGSSSSSKKRLRSTSDESKSSSSSNSQSSKDSRDSSGSSASGGSSSLSTDSSEATKAKAARKRSDKKAKKTTADTAATSTGAKKGRGRGRGRNGRGKPKGVASQPEVSDLPEPTESPRKFARLQPAVISLELDSD